MRKIIIAIILLLAAFTLLLGYTSPNNVTLPVYLAVFAVIYLFFALIVFATISLAYNHMARTRIIFLSVVIAFAPVILLALNTISTLSLLDIILALGIPLIVVWYGFKRGF